MEIATEMAAIFLIILSFFIFMNEFRIMSLLGDQKDLGDFVDRPDDVIKFHFWIELEVIFAIAIVASNSLYLMIRFCFKERITLEPADFE